MKLIESGSRMAISRFVVVSAFCTTLFMMWLNSMRLPFKEQEPVPRFMESRTTALQLRNRTVLNRLAKEKNSSLNTVVVIGYRKFGVHKYPINCDCDGGKYFVTNETAYLENAQILVFTLGARRNMTLDDWRRYNRERKEEQIWVLGSRESPQTCTAVLPPEDMGKVYNWSFTYHSRADFPTPYGGYKKFRQQKFGSTNWYSQKKNLISWTSSHCPLPDSRYKRRDFVFLLKKYLNIDMYGTCGEGRLDGPDFKETLKSYKFALVLENSCCSEYITEKFWDALTIYNQVPVVYGATREEYERIAPPGSFIFIQDFSSLKELALYIKWVGSSKSEYNKYHYWRKLGYAYKLSDQEDVRVYGCHSICRMASKRKEMEGKKSVQFDQKSEVYSGGCRECQKEIDLLTGNATY